MSRSEGNQGEVESSRLLKLIPSSPFSSRNLTSFVCHFSSVALTGQGGRLRKERLVTTKHGHSYYSMGTNPIKYQTIAIISPSDNTTTPARIFAIR